MVSILGSAGSTVTDIEVREAPGQSAQARLQLDGPGGRSEIRVEVGQAISLSVKIGKPIQVSAGLIEAVKPPSTPTLPSTPEAGTPESSTPSAGTSPPEPAKEPAAAVPEQFRRAFEQ
jgi:hypothetical protein